MNSPNNPERVKSAIFCRGVVRVRACVIAVHQHENSDCSENRTPAIPSGETQ